MTTLRFWTVAQLHNRRKSLPHNDLRSPRKFPRDSAFGFGSPAVIPCGPARAPHHTHHHTHHHTTPHHTMARTTKRTESTPIDAETLEALAAFQDEHGPEWRTKLIVAWMYGQTSICGLTLYRARNIYGNRLLV